MTAPRLSGTDPMERIEAFERELVGRLSTRVERCAFGRAYFNDGFPRRWDSNFVWVTEPLDGVRGEALAADADEVLGRAGIEHRVLWVGDVAQGDRLVPELERHGYEPHRHVVMVHAREPDRWTDGDAEEIDLSAAKRFHTMGYQDDPDVDSAADAEMLAAFRDVMVEHVGARFFGARVDTEVVSACDLYVLGGTAQVEDVLTLPSHRGRGLARAVVLAAVRAAREAGADLVYLGAHEEDWPKLLYAKLGFDQVARSIDFIRKPPVQRS